MMPGIMSTSPIFEFNGKMIDEVPETAPPVRQACSLTVNSWSNVRSPFFRRSNTTSSVISFDMLAGAISLSAFFSNRIACAFTS